MGFKIMERQDSQAMKTRIKLRTNGGYCPCAIVKNKDTKCMCKKFREQTEPGICHCGLYEKINEQEG